MGLWKILLVIGILFALFYGVVFVFSTFSLLEIFTFLFIGVGLIGTSIFMISIMRGEKAHG